jgi:hypothetical protein
MYSHVSRESIQSLVKVVHLDEDTKHNDNPENICTRMGELVVTRHSEFDCDPEAFDGHDGYRADGGAY